MLASAMHNRSNPGRYQNTYIATKMYIKLPVKPSPFRQDGFEHLRMINSFKIVTLEIQKRRQRLLMEPKRSWRATAAY